MCLKWSFIVGVCNLLWHNANMEVSAQNKFKVTTHFNCRKKTLQTSHKKSVTLFGWYTLNTWTDFMTYVSRRWIYVLGFRLTYQHWIYVFRFRLTNQHLLTFSYKFPLLFLFLQYRRLLVMNLYYEYWKMKRNFTRRSTRWWNHCVHLRCKVHRDHHR